MSDSVLWTAKLHARLHDPAEKALILMRTSEGHENGTSRELQRELFPDGLSDTVRTAVRRADHWASAADRAAFPKHDTDGRYPAWQTVRFHEQPIIIHPLTGGTFDLGTLAEVEPEQAKALSLDHFRKLIHADDLKKTSLAFWRFGPDIDAQEIRTLWRLLPADTRVPDHSIWDHLDLVSAFTAAFSIDPADGPALLAVNLGPVQSFIAASRSTSDLWAGSHLLARLSWEAMKVVCEELGPESILFPRLRDVPQVDLWLRDECGLRADLFADCDWAKSRTDANPLFAAALPNRFTALVPANRARELADKITTRVRNWAVAHCELAYRKLLDVAEIADCTDLPGYTQIREQLEAFPEVNWAAVPWSLIGQDDRGKVDASDPRLADAMRPFFESDPPGFLDSAAWKLMSGGLALEAGWFWKPNPGSLYPALHELLERVLAASKSARVFRQTTQEGWRDSLTGESEWLTTDRAQLRLAPGQRKETLWAKVARKRPAWVKKGEHLGALNTLKRLWPTLFVDELHAILEMELNRFVVSTHTMAMASSLSAWLDGEQSLPPGLANELDNPAPRVALPRKLVGRLRKHDESARLMNLPGWFEAAHQAEDSSIGQQADRLLAKMLGHKPEAYYALLLMDGDNMGAWLSAADTHTPLQQSSFHPQIRNAAANRFGGDVNFRQFAESRRAANPARHMAISEALNNFALTLAPAIVEQHFHGRVLYAGGDDLLAMVPVTDLLPVMAALRGAYSGIAPTSVGSRDEDAGYQHQENGFVRHGKRVLRVMGEGATASVGAVIAHHQTPLSLVMRELRAAEQRAKHDGGRNAFSISVLKRSGGALRLTSRWQRKDAVSPMTCLRELADALRSKEASRRAAYNVEAWSPDLPEPGQLGDDNYRRMLEQLLAYQFKRQGVADPETHALRLAQMAPLTDRAAALGFINNFLSVAEFLARDGRS